MTELVIRIKLNDENAKLLEQLDARQEYLEKELEEWMGDEIVNRFPVKNKHYDLQGSLKLMLLDFMAEFDDLDEEM